MNFQHKTLEEIHPREFLHVSITTEDSRSFNTKQLNTASLKIVYSIQKNLVAQSLHPQDGQLSNVDYHF